MTGYRWEPTKHQHELPYSLWLIPAAAFALLGIAAAVALA